MQVAWVASPRGRLVRDYQERLGLTFEQALARAAETLGKFRLYLVSVWAVLALPAGLMAGGRINRGGPSLGG